MSALRSASHLSWLENDNVTIQSESGAAQGRGFPCDTHSGLQDPGGTNRYQPVSAIAAAWRRFKVLSSSHRQVSQRLPALRARIVPRPGPSRCGSQARWEVSLVSQTCKVGSVRLPKPIPPASASKETQFRLSPDLKDYIPTDSFSHSPPSCQ